MGGRQGRRAAARGRLGLRRRPRARRRGRAGRRRVSVSVLTGGCTRDELLDAGTHVVLDDLDGLPRLARRAPARPPAGGPGGRPARARLGAGRLQRRRRQRPPARRRRPRARAPTGSSPRPATPTRCPASSATRPVPSRSRSGCRGAHPAHPRDGARGLPRQRRRPLLLLQGRAARRARARSPPSTASPTSPPAPTPTTRWPASGPASGPPPSGARHAAARRRPHQGRRSGPRLAPLGPAHLGQARRRLPVLPGRLRRRGDPVPAGPGRARRGRRAGRAGRAGVDRCGPAGARPRRPGLGRDRRRPARAGRWPRGTVADAVVAAVVAAGFAEAGLDPRGLPLRLDERAARRGIRGCR